MGNGGVIVEYVSTKSLRDSDFSVRNDMTRGTGYPVLRYFLDASYAAGKPIPNFLHKADTSRKSCTLS